MSDSTPQPPDDAATDPVDERPARERARELATQLREDRRKRDRRRDTIIRGSVLGGTVALLGVVALVLVTTASGPARGPANMISDGIKIGQDFVAVRTAALQPKQEPVASGQNASGVLDIRLYVDYLCPNCATFESENGDQLRRWVESGAATVEIHPIAVLSAKSAGTQYSLRAANAAACVADASPDSFFAFHTALFAEQPDEGTPGLSDDELLSLAVRSGADDTADLSECVHSLRFRSWVQAATSRALTGPLPGLDDGASVTSTPTVIVDGRPFLSTENFAAEEFASFVVKAAGDRYAIESEATATPTPTPTPTPAS
ncbi:MAG: thioredoxin domain-containing protein [Actinomycetales bacterium]|nr:thioredoxin domain-containing protein [Actinomycetales bacterium]